MSRATRRAPLRERARVRKELLERVENQLRLYLRGHVYLEDDLRELVAQDPSIGELIRSKLPKPRSRSKDRRALFARASPGYPYQGGAFELGKKR